MIANREAYGLALVSLYEKNKNIVVLDADLAKATFTDTFRKAHGDRFIDCGIAEQNMMGVAAGLATTGLVPFVSTFAVFASLRASEQFRNSVCYPHLNVKVVATHAGIECGADGATHQALEDLAVMRTMPGNVVLVPADPVATRELVYLMAEHDGPAYMRVGRDKMPDLYSDTTKFNLGGSHTLKEGTDAYIIACGSRVHAALEAAEKLKAERNINVGVIDMYSIKPIDEEAIVRAAMTGLIVTCEDHQRAGGLGAAVCEVCCEKSPCRVIRMGVDDSFGRSGSAKELFELYHLSADDIVKTVADNLN